MMIYSTGAPDPPIGLSATQVGHTSIRVSWTAPVSGATVTGYRISYSGGTDRGIVDVAIDHTITIPQSQSPLTYSISIITLSSSFPSSMAGPITVTVGKYNAYSFCMSCEATATIPTPVRRYLHVGNRKSCAYCIFCNLY